MNFLLGRGLPFCLGVGGLVIVTFLIVFASSRVLRESFNFGGQDIRDWLGWVFSPKNMFILLPVVLVLAAVVVCLATSRYW